MFGRALAALLLAVVLGPITATTAAADPLPPLSYADAVQQAFDVIQGASPQDPAPATAAVHLLAAGTGDSQPEIIADLVARPPQYDDASKRLAALLAAATEPATTSDPALAQQRLHDVMSMTRYDALHRPPSLLDRFYQWASDLISALLRLLFGSGAGSQTAALWLEVVGVLVVLGVIVVIFRASGGRLGQSARVAPGGPRPAADYFAEADHLAGRGDRVGAIRALCAGVAATLAGERSWEGSPLTVREIFQRAPDFGSLRQLLLPFEAAVYGRREVDIATYEKAAQVAARYRQPVEAAA
ncbi:MAG: hypothetical protein E6J20_05265 [Chloroflexi bacterium]|nr:MAG: hypothetical protein E6J20_05265 [Chloroflexota bacterium]